ncbi:MAG: extracellular solute-binding protein [Lachnospiraceae bacterium]|nr:extracellular solute-binding protein [Lachnospiraceae bacterium]
MKKALCAFISLILMMSVFTGCHGSRGLEAFRMPETFDTSKNYEITFWAKNDTNKAQTEIYAKAAEDFEKLYPNVKVNIRLYTDYGKIYNDVITNIATQTTPNVCITYPDHIATYLTGVNVVVPLDEVFSDGKYGLGGSELRFDGVKYDEMVPEFLKECRIGDETYAVPYMRSTEACYINKNFVEALGYTIPETLTWDFVWEVSEAAMKKDAEGNFLLNGQKVLIPFIYKSSDNMMITYLRQADAGYSLPDGTIEIFNDTTFSFLREISAHAKSGAFSTFKISGYPGNFLNAGQCIFAIDSTAGATWMGAEAPLMDIHRESVADFETVVTEIPQIDPSHPKMISQGPSVCVFNKKDPQEVLASWLFAQFLLTNEVQNAYAMTEGYLPVTKKAQDSAEYKDYLARAGEDNDKYYYVKIEASKLLMRNIENTFTTPVFNGSASLRDASSQLIENTAKAVRRGNTVDDAFMQNLEKDVTSLYRLDQLSKRQGTGTKPEITGKLPTESKVLFIVLGVAWAGIACAYVTKKIKNRKAR